MAMSPCGNLRVKGHKMNNSPAATVNNDHSVVSRFTLLKCNAGFAIDCCVCLNVGKASLDGSNLLCA